MSSYIKLRFFNRIRRFLSSKTMMKQHTNNVVLPLECSSNLRASNCKANSIEEEDDSAHVVLLQRAVKKLHFGNSDQEKEMGAIEIRNLLSLANNGSNFNKQDYDNHVKLRNLMVDLGVIPALVSMVEYSPVVLKPLIHLAHGSFKNKALMVEAGIFSRLPDKTHDIGESSRHEFAILLFSLSSLANTKFSLSSTAKLTPFLVSILDSTSFNLETKECCLGTFLNLSKLLEHSGDLVSHGVVEILLNLSLTKQISDKALATLGNLVVTLKGKKGIEKSPDAVERLIEILKWEEEPKCQELSAYILIILAHKNPTQREKMVNSGIVSVLLKLALLGTPLAQKRAFKLLQWFKDEREAKVGSFSGPQTGRASLGSPSSQREAQEGKKLMKNLVRQSLYKNFEMITRRAYVGTEEEYSSNRKTFVISTSSKSLPY